LSPPSKADIAAHSINVHFAPESGHSNSLARCPLCAKSGHYAVQQKALHSIRPAPGSATKRSLRLLLQKSVLAAPA
jgi:hypothetical protein